MTEIKSHAKVGVYVDAANISRNGGQRMQYDLSLIHIPEPTRPY